MSSTLSVGLIVVLNVVSTVFGVGLTGYLALWLAGCKLPGTGSEPFKGWNFARCTDPDDDLRRTRA